MFVHLYSGCRSLVAKSGVGEAILHQREMLTRAGLDTTDHWSPAADILHCNTIFPDSVWAARRAKRRGEKVVYYGHSTMEDFRNSFKCSNLFAPLFRRWIIHCYEAGDVVITPTPYSKRLLEGYGIRKPIYALSNGIDTDFFAPDIDRRLAWRETYGLRPDEKAVISVGHYIARKGLPDFVALARELPDIRFFWFGYTNLNLVPAEIREAIEHAPSNLSFPGYVNREELRNAYCGCDLFAFLSHEETEGIVVLEALACGIPVLVRDIPVYEDWLEDSVNVYKAQDLIGFRDRLEGILSGALPNLTARGRTVAQARSLTATGNRLLEIYAETGLLPQPERLPHPCDTVYAVARKKPA